MCGAETWGLLVVAVVDLVECGVDGLWLGPDVVFWSVLGVGSGDCTGAEEDVGFAGVADVSSLVDGVSWLVDEISGDVLDVLASGARPELAPHPEAKPAAIVTAAIPPTPRLSDAVVARCIRAPVLA
jgi:hypothetical protein